METWKNWALFLFCAAALAYYYTPRSVIKQRRKSAIEALGVESLQKSASRRRLDRKSVPVKDALSSSDRALETKSEPLPNSSAKTHKKQARETVSKPAAPVVHARNAHEQDEAEDNQDWVKQLAAAQKGVSMKSQDKTVTAGRSRKPKPLAASPDFQSTSSSTGADADDDLSPLPTPQMAAATNSQPSGRDISDMLDAPAPGPSVLRLTGDVNPAKKQTARAAPVAQETKKQRQNRRKRELQKQLRDEDEKERRVLMEQQRRGAREARGEPAKNGLGPAKPPQNSVWTSTPTDTNGVAAVKATNGDLPLLDTFDQDAASTASSSEPLTTGHTSSTAMSILEQDLPSEDEQLRMLSEMNGDSGWNEVGGKKQKKRKDSPPQSDVQPLAKSIPVPKQVPSKPAVSTNNGYSALNKATGGHILDSEWEV